MEIELFGWVSVLLAAAELAGGSSSGRKVSTFGRHQSGQSAGRVKPRRAPSRRVPVSPCHRPSHRREAMRAPRRVGRPGLLSKHGGQLLGSKDATNTSTRACVHGERCRAGKVQTYRHASRCDRLMCHLSNRAGGASDENHQDGRRHAGSWIGPGGPWMRCTRMHCACGWLTGCRTGQAFGHLDRPIIPIGRVGCGVPLPCEEQGRFPTHAV